MLRVAVTKGRIENDFTKLLYKAGFESLSICNKGRKLLVKTGDDIEFIFFQNLKIF
jgi:ATP phosphoribosyltransferase